MKIAFVWQGFNGRFGKWKDGLWLAMQKLEKKHEVRYYEPWDDINDADVILYWEAPCTINGSNAPHYKKVRANPIKKILLFAGGPIKKDWVEGFDLLCVESAINADECEMMGIPHMTAFGINDEIMRPLGIDKKWDGIHQGTSASWKRQWLMAEALEDKCLLVGRYQKEDPYPFDRSRELGATIMDEVSQEEICKLLNESVCLVQTSEYWGGGQRATLEAMSCGIPVICMEDSPKNREYVEESGAGIVCHPSKEQIRKAVEEIKGWTKEQKERGIAYVKMKWTAEHYANSLEEAIIKVTS